MEWSVHPRSFALPAPRMCGSVGNTGSLAAGGDSDAAAEWPISACYKGKGRYGLMKRFAFAWLLVCSVAGTAAAQTAPYGSKTEASRVVLRGVGNSESSTAPSTVNTTTTKMQDSGTVSKLQDSNGDAKLA